MGGPPPFSAVFLYQVKTLCSKNRNLKESTFDQEFHKLFRHRLDPVAYGHSSLNSLLCALANDKVIELVNENCMLTIRPSKETILEMKRLTDEMNNTSLPSEAADISDLDSVVKGNRGGSLVVPSDAVLHCTFPVEELPSNLKEGDSFVLVVTQVDSPGKFWFNLVQDDQTNSVKEIMNSMDRFYTGVKGDKYRIKNSSRLQKGNVLAARYKTGGFHRVLVVKVIDDAVVKLFYVDFGTVDNQKVKYCRYLHQQFARLPGQAIQARLWGVGPIGGGKWDDSHRSRNRLLELVNTIEGGLIAEIRSGVTRREVVVKGSDEIEKDRCLALSLIDVFYGDDGLDIATQMVDENLVEWEQYDAEEVLHLIQSDGTVLEKVKRYMGPTKSRPENNHRTRLEESVVHKSKYLRLLEIHEDSLKKLRDLVKYQISDLVKSRVSKARLFSLEGCITDISRRVKEVCREEDC